MTSFLRRHAAKGFTLIELLIVVIIIAILAAIAIPQFANTSNDAQESALDANLSTVRSAIELYRIQHNNIYPGVNAATGGAAACTAAGGALGTGALNTALAFTDQLTGFSNVQGQTCTVSATGFIFGPYLRAMPNEPINNVNNVTMFLVANPAAPAANDTGWRFNTMTGRFSMNSAALDRRGTAYSAH
jgi:prepilin-type N-terminal cleavage/methylation domain-containing protein